MNEEIKEQLSELRGLLADSFQKYFNFEYTEAFQMAVLSVVNLPLGLELEFPNDWLPELERVRRGFKKRDYMAMVEIGYAAYADLFTSGIENPSVKDACGFAHAVGVASGAIGQAIHFRESRRPGGKGRANKIANTEQRRALQTGFNPLIASLHCSHRAERRFKEQWRCKLQPSNISITRKCASWSGYQKHQFEAVSRPALFPPRWPCLRAVCAFVVTW